MHKSSFIVPLIGVRYILVSIIIIIRVIIILNLILLLPFLLKTKDKMEMN